MTLGAVAFREETSSSFPVLREAHHRLERYDLRFELAHGGMATVYLAYAGSSMGVGRVAAVKVIHPHLAKENDYVEMFLDEARLASLISHPNVCGVYDFGEADGTYFIAMEYLRGEPLGQMQRAIRRRGSPQMIEDVPLLAARIVSEAAEGLHAAHVLEDPATGRCLNVVHRDVSPQNVFVTYDGAVRVVDFGVARAEGRIHHTKTGTVKGKFAYMAPEQMRAQPIDHRADVWALGVLLWETCALRRLFRRGNEADTVMAVTMDPIPRLRDLAPEVPAELDRIAHRALQRDPDARYATAREMATELNAFLASHGHGIGNAQVSEWMNAMFPRRMARKEQLVQLAAQGATAHLPFGLTDDDDLDGSSASLAAVEIEVDLEPTQPPPAREPALRLGRARVTIALGALLAIGLATFGIARMVGGIDRAPAREARAPEVTPVVDAVEAPEPEAAPPAEPTEPAVIAEAEPEPRSEAEAAPEAEATPELEAPPEAEAAVPEAAPAPTRRVRRRRPRAAPAPAGPPGRVALVTTGAWAEVYEGSRLLGQTPGSFSLPPGRHALTLRPFGTTDTRTVRVEVRSGETSRVRVDLR